MPPRLKNPNLTISPTPFKSSFLSIPPSPFSPRTPLTPLPRPLRSPHTQTFTQTNPPSAQTSTNPPPPPLSWQWQCHLCRRHYPLGATRRCLDDGHFFCAGVTRVHTWRTKSDGVKKRVKRHRACGSEFDYGGWKGRRRWQRGGVQRKLVLGGGTGRNGVVEEKSEGMLVKKDCWRNCDYPSECRWGRRAGIHSPVEEEEVVMESAVKIEDVEAPISMGTVEQSEIENTCDSMSVTENVDEDENEDDQELDLWRTLQRGIQRRKQNLAQSPLAPIHEEETQEPNPYIERDTTGDIIMQTIDPRLLDLPPSVSQPIWIPPPAEPKGSAAADMLRGLIESRESRRRGSRCRSVRERERFSVQLLTGGRTASTSEEEEEGWRGEREREREEMLSSLAPLERMVV